MSTPLFAAAFSNGAVIETTALDWVAAVFVCQHALPCAAVPCKISHPGKKGLVPHIALVPENVGCISTIVLQGRTALDLLSEELKVFMEQQQAGSVFSWGNGANYQLGTGATGLQSSAVRLDALRKELVVQVAAAKFHSAAVTKNGRLFTWGFGRGGRLGEHSSCASQSSKIYK